MEKIKKFLNSFVEIEAKVATQKRKPDISAYNQSIETYYSMMVKQLRGATGYIPLSVLRSEEDYESLKDYPDDIARHLYKISKYNHQKYGDVWIAYLSAQNPRPEIKRLNNAIIVIDEDGYKVAKFMLYTDYTENNAADASFHWEEMWGYSDLKFENLDGPKEILRIQEPSSRNGGDLLFSAEI